MADTLVTNAPNLAHVWLNLRPEAVSKTLSSPIVFDDDTARGFSFTRVLDAADRRELDSVAVTPTQFQTLIDPAFELRVTSIGSRHIAVGACPGFPDGCCVLIMPRFLWRCEGLRSRRG